MIIFQLKKHSGYMNTETFIEKVIPEIKSEMKERYPDFKGLYFFGSRLKGTAEEFSDYDIVLVFDRQITWTFKNETWNFINKFIIEYDIIIDTHIYNSQDILNPVTPFRNNVKAEGQFYAS